MGSGSLVELVHWFDSLLQEASEPTATRWVAAEITTIVDGRIS
jgi:hypothetical protein